MQVEKEKIKAEIIAKRESEEKAHEDLMAKIKRDKLMKDAEEAAHKEIAEEEVRKRRSVSSAVQK